MPRQAPLHTPHPPPISGRIVLAAVLSAKADVDTALAPARAWLSSQQAAQLVGTHIQRRGVSRSNSPGGAARLDAACLRRVATAPHSHDDLFHTLLGLTDVRTSLYQPDHDIFLTCRAGQ